MQPQSVVMMPFDSSNSSAQYASSAIDREERFEKRRNETSERIGEVSMVKIPRCDESATGNASCVASLDQYVGIDALRDRL